jgi:hypothetical protein
MRVVRVLSWGLVVALLASAGTLWIIFGLANGAIR